MQHPAEVTVSRAARFKALEQSLVPRGANVEHSSRQSILGVILERDQRSGHYADYGTVRLAPNSIGADSAFGCPRGERFSVALRDAFDAAERGWESVPARPRASNRARRRLRAA
jgi:hypothetical protein